MHCLVVARSQQTSSTSAMLQRHRTAGTPVSRSFSHSSSASAGTHRPRPASTSPPAPWTASHRADIRPRPELPPDTTCTPPDTTLLDTGCRAAPVEQPTFGVPARNAPEALLTVECSFDSRGTSHEPRRRESSGSMPTTWGCCKAAAAAPHWASMQ